MSAGERKAALLDRKVLLDEPTKRLDTSVTVDAVLISWFNEYAFIMPWKNDTLKYKRRNTQGFDYSKLLVVILFLFTFSIV